MKRAFTILELMAVVSILGILLGIVMSAAANSIRLTRRQKANASAAIVKQGIETYYQQYDKWPGGLGDIANGDGVSTKTNEDGYDHQTNNDIYWLDEAGRVKSTIKAVVDECVNNNPMMDISGLFVSRDPGDKNGKGYGLDFWEAVRGNEHSKKRMSVAEMNYGYPDPSTGRFRRFRLRYSVPTRSVEVRTWD